MIFILCNIFVVVEYLLLIGSGCFLEMVIFGEYLCVIVNFKGLVFVIFFDCILSKSKKIVVVYYINSLEVLEVVGDERKLFLGSDKISGLFYF